MWYYSFTRTFNVRMRETMRKSPIVENEYYHIYNRGVDKRDVFQDKGDFGRFVLAMNLLNDRQDGLMQRWREFRLNHPEKHVRDFLLASVKSRTPLVDVIAYCLNPNHYHFILKQRENDDGIKIFMQRLGNSYTRYFNEKNKRNGALFQGRFKSTHIKSTSQLLRMSVYVNCNSEIHGICAAKDYKWCGFPEYLGERGNKLCNKKVVTSHFVGSKKYMTYTQENIRDFRDRKEDEKSLLLE